MGGLAGITVFRILPVAKSKKRRRIYVWKLDHFDRFKKPKETPSGPDNYPIEGSGYFSQFDLNWVRKRVFGQKILKYNITD